MNARKAIISVSNKHGLEQLARFFVDEGIEILSTGGTATFLESHGIPYRQVSDYTGSPEILDGRVKTLHPKIHGGILARRDLPEHQAQCREHDIAPIDWIIVNLYPFAETIQKPNCTFEDAIENIDIGGPSLLRGAAKNFQDVVVCVDPTDYPRLIEAYRAKTLSHDLRLSLAHKVFSHTAAYDAMIAQYLGNKTHTDLFKEPKITLTFDKAQDLRYGENPHQRAMYLKWPQSPPAFEQLQGKELSYNNLIDLTAAFDIIREFDNETACAIIKHTNPCGIGTSKTSVLEAFERAKSCDPVSAFGGIVAVSDAVSEELALSLSELFLEVIVAPAFEAAALARLSSKKNLRLIRLDPTPSLREAQLEFRRVTGGLLLQEGDTGLKKPAAWTWVTQRQATPAELSALELAWKAVKHVKSNAIVIASDTQTIGIGAGQMSRVDSVKLSGIKARFPIKGAALASDAFFPFRDNIDEAAALGIRAIVQPGGSVRDDEVIAAANEHGIAMAFTGERHFKH